MRRRSQQPHDETDALLGSAKADEHHRLRSLDALRSTATLPFDENSEDHMRLLTNLWKHEFPNARFEIPSERWKDVGFQGRDPRTDLRGAGIIGLQHLQHVVLTQRPALEAMHSRGAHTPIREFPLSIASINVTAMLLSYFHVAPKLTLAFLPGGRLECAATTLSGFLSLGDSPNEQTDDEEGEERERVGRLERALAAMHARLLLHLASLWASHLASDPTVTIMDFPVALRATFHAMQQAVEGLEATRPWTLPEVMGALAPGRDAREEDSSWVQRASRGLLDFVVGWCTCGTRAGTKRD